MYFKFTSWQVKIADLRGWSVKRKQGLISDEKFAQLLPSCLDSVTTLRSTVAPLANVAATFVGNGGSTPPHPFFSSKNSNFTQKIIIE